jgi:hypothetical protein
MIINRCKFAHRLLELLTYIGILIFNIFRRVPDISRTFFSGDTNRNSKINMRGVVLRTDLAFASAIGQNFRRSDEER